MNNMFYTDHNIQKPDLLKISKKKARDILVIDSRDRNTKLFPNSNKYIYNLIDTYKNVTEIELINAYIPDSQTIVNKSNNRIDITYNNVKKILFLNIGNYINDGNNDKEGEDIINNTLKKYKHLYNSSLNEGLQIYYDYNSKKYIFYNKMSKIIYGNNYNIPNKFTLHFGSSNKKSVIYMGNKELIDDYIDNSIGKLLGFQPRDYSNVTPLRYNSNYNPSNNTITLNFNNKIDFDNALYLIQKNDNNLAMYFNGNDNNNNYDFIFIDIENPNTQIENIDYNLLTIIMNTPDIYDSNGNIINTIINIDSILHPIIADFSENKNEENYILLKIPELSRFDSIDTTIQNSFALINTSNTNRVFENSNPGNIKYFNPPLPKLDKLSINFCNYGGREVNFNGLNHCLVFSIEYVNQPYQLDF